MNVKEVKPINFLFFRASTTIKELSQFFPVAKDLYREAVKYDLHVTGPIHWHYFGFTGDESQPFNLEISLPVSDVVQDYDGSFHFKRTEAFKCVTHIHEGAWHEIPQTYAKLLQFMGEQNLTPIAVNREIYVNADFQSPEANVTEIQMGVRAAS
jgi:effector-binding domain-containing protein